MKFIKRFYLISIFLDEFFSKEYNQKSPFQFYSSGNIFAIPVFKALYLYYIADEQWVLEFPLERIDNKELFGSNPQFQGRRKVWKSKGAISLSPGLR